jgi:hypothetical protein
MARAKNHHDPVGVQTEDPGIRQKQERRRVDENGIEFATQAVQKSAEPIRVQ